MSIVITLVHGTRPPNPLTNRREEDYDYREWGRLERALRQLDDQVEVQTFSWPGYNSLSVRAGAAEGLAMLLEDALTRRPEALHYVVAHSHGGNIALHAAEQIGFGRRPKCRAVICLATPFLSVDLKAHFPLESTMAALAAFPVGALAMWATSDAAASWLGGISYVGPSAAWLAARSVTWWLWICSAIGASTALLLILSWVNAAYARNKLAVPDLPRRKVWAVTYPTDEPIKWLHAAQGVLRSKASRALAERGIIGGEPLRRVLRVLTMIEAIALGATALGLSGWLPPTVKWWAAIVLLVTAAAAALPMVVLTVLIARTMPRAAGWFGLQLASALPFLEVAVNSTPRGKGGKEIPLKSTQTLFHHSMLYKDRNAIQKIAKWIRRDMDRYYSSDTQRTVTPIPEAPRHDGNRR